MNKETLPQRLRWARDVADLSARDLSLRAGVSHAIVNLIERGKKLNPTASTLTGIANVLGVSLDWLYLGVGPRPSRERIRQHVASDHRTSA